MMTKIFKTAFLKQSLQIKFYFAFALVTLISFSACKKEETDTNAYTVLSVVNASPTVGTYDVYLDDAKLNAAAIPFGGSIAYTQLLAGTHNLKFSTAGRGESLLTKSVGLTQNNYFSFYLINRPANLDGFLVNDDLSANSTTTAFVRFVNVSPDAPALNLILTGGNSLFTNTAFKTASAFIPVAAGACSFDVKDATGNLKVTSESVTLIAGFHYTVLARGLVTPSSDGSEHPLSALVIQHK